MKSIAYIAGYTFGTTKSLISRIPQPDVDKIKADFNQAIADQQAPKPAKQTDEPTLAAEPISPEVERDLRVIKAFGEILEARRQ